MGNSELKPCLRCGGKAKLLGVGTSVIRRTYALECDSCHYLTKWSESIAEVIKLWNTRTKRIQLVPLDKYKLREFMKARGYDSETMTDSICQTFGQPKDAVSVPTVEEINKVLLESPRHKYNYETKEYDTQAKAIHDLITRKLKG